MGRLFSYKEGVLDMILFCKPSGNTGTYQLLIPMNRVYDVRAVGSKIFINYDGGVLIKMDDDSTYQPRIETIKIEFEDSSEVEDRLREFYTSLNNGKQAFYFG